MEGYKKAVSLCILRNGDNYLLLKRGKEKTKKEEDSGLYIPVGGKIEPYETPEEAARREVKEETGIEVSDIIFKGILFETCKEVDYNWINFVYTADIEYFEPCECNEGFLEWINKENILNIPTPEIDKEIYKYIVNDQKFIFNDVYDKNLQLIYAKEEITEKIIVEGKKDYGNRN